MANRRIVISLDRQTHADIIKLWEHTVRQMGHEMATAYFMMLIRAGMARPDVVGYLLQAEIMEMRLSRVKPGRRRTGKYRLQLRLDPLAFMDISCAWHETMKRHRSSRFTEYLRAGMYLLSDEVPQTGQQDRPPPAASPPSTAATAANAPDRTSEDPRPAVRKSTREILDRFLEGLEK